MSAIVGLFTDLLPSGGVQRAGRHIAAVLAKFSSDRGMSARFLSLNDPRGLHKLRVGPLEFSVSGHAGSKAGFALAALRAAGRGPALVVAGHPHLAPVVQLMKARGGFPSVVFAHGVEVWEPLGWPRGAALRGADLVVGPSSDTVRHLVADQRIPESKVRRTAWGLDPDFEARVRAAAAPPLPPEFPREGRVILSVGRWDRAEKYKGADTLIEGMPGVLQKVPNASLVLVGDGDDRPRLEQLARDRGVSERTRFLHGLSGEELSACYANCNVFALPSRGEGFGLVFLEAMAYAKPVIGGAHGGIPDIVEDGASGWLVPFGDVERLTGALEALLANPERAHDMGARGRQRVESEFTFDKFQARLTALIEEALRLRRSANKARS